MIKILLKNSTIVVFDPDNNIDEDELNKYLISLIDKIDGHSQSVERAKRKNEYLMINQYANISVKKLLDIFRKFLEQRKIEYVWTDNFSNEFLDFLPNRDFSTGEIAGGVAPDTIQIEKGIESLVEILNEFEGIQTFGSCEGHEAGNIICRAYVTYTASSIDGLNHSTFILKNAINTVWEKIDNENFTTTQTLNRILLSFNTSLWRRPLDIPTAILGGPSPGENYYKFEFTYKFEFQKLVFNIIEDIVFEMRKLNETFSNRIQRME